MGQAQAVEGGQAIDGWVELQAAAGWHRREEAAVEGASLVGGPAQGGWQAGPAPLDGQKDHVALGRPSQEQGKRSDRCQGAPGPIERQPQHRREKDAVQGVDLGDDGLGPEHRRNGQGQRAQQGRQPPPGASIPQARQLSDHQVNQGHRQGAGHRRKQVDRASGVIPRAQDKELAQQGVEGVAGRMGDGQFVADQGELQAVIKDRSHRGGERLHVQGQGQQKAEGGQPKVAGTPPGLAGHGYCALDVHWSLVLPSSLTGSMIPQVEGNTKHSPGTKAYRILGQLTWHRHCERRRFCRSEAIPSCGRVEGCFAGACSDKILCVPWTPPVRCESAMRHAPLHQMAYTWHTVCHLIWMVV